MKRLFISYVGLGVTFGLLNTASAQDSNKVMPASILPPKPGMTQPVLLPAPTPTPPLLNTAAPVNSIPQGGYVLVSMTDDKGELKPVSGKAPTLQLDGKRASGNDGCNAYGGAYVAREKFLRFGAMAGTMMACEQGVMNQASQYLQLLSKVRGYTLQGNTLTLLSGTAGQLVFTKQAGHGELTGGGIKSNLNGTWTFAGVYAPNGNPGINPAHSNMNFTIQGSDISGNDGCNQFRGKVSFSLGVLKLTGPVAATRMFCPDHELSLYTMLGDGISPNPGAHYQVSGHTLSLTQGALIWHFEKK